MPPALTVEPPEGGLRAWLVVLGAWLLQFCTIGYTNAHGAYNDYYVRKYLNVSSTTSEISLIGSTQLFVVFSLGLVGGRMFDTGYCYFMVVGGSVLLVLCLFMLSLSHPQQFYQVFLAQGLGVGLASGITYVPSYGIIPHYFRRRRALAMGIVSSGAAVGGAVHPIMLDRLFNGPLGFHNGVRVSAIFIGVLLLVANMLIKPRYPLTPRKGGSAFNDIKIFSQDAPYVLTALGTFLSMAGVYYPNFFLQFIAIKNGIDSSIAFYTLVALNLASAIGRVVPTFLVSKFGVFNITIPCVFICGSLMFCTLALNTVASTFIFAALYGFFTGAYTGLYAPMITSLAQKDTEIGARLGISLFPTGLGALVGYPIAGALLTKHFAWWRPTLFAAVCIFSCVLCFVASRFLLSKRKGTWRV